MKQRWRFTNLLKLSQPGQLLIELLLAIGIFSLMIPAIIAGFVSSNQSDVANQRRIEATALAREINEALRVVRQGSWEAVATPGTYHLEQTATSWTLAPNAAITAEGYTQEITLASVNRNATGEIVTTGGTVDPSTRRATITVSWTEPGPGSVSQETILTRYLDNIIVPDTTAAQFELGEQSGTAVVSNEDGEVTLGAGGSGDWCLPVHTRTSVNLSKSGLPMAVSAIPGQIVVGTGANASGKAFTKIAVDQNAHPPTAVENGTLDGYKANGVFIESHYAYLATDTNDREVVVLDLDQYIPATDTYNVVASFDSPGSTNAVTVAAAGNLGFVVAGNTLHSFNAADKKIGMTRLASLTLPGPGTKVVVVGNDLYISIGLDNNAKKMQIVRFNASTGVLQNYGYLQVNAGPGRDVVANSLGTRAYLVTGYSANPEFYVINTETKGATNPALNVIGSYQTVQNMDPRGLAVVPGNKAVVVGINGIEYQPIRLFDETQPSQCGDGLEVNEGINAIATVLESDNDAYSYIVTNNASAELQIIEGGPGGQYANEGTFTSRIFNVGYSSVFNFFDWVVQSTPPATTIRYQLALADPVNGGCDDANYVFIGPDPDDRLGSWFTEPAGFPFDDDGVGYENPGQCFRYKLHLSTLDSFISPTFMEMNVNYNP